MAPLRRGRLPGLDGLRAIAVLLVIFYHLTSQGALASLPVLTQPLKQGAFGVQIFFVLSGFLITWLLLGEERARGGIRTRHFYLRRSFRILPPALFYLAVVALLTRCDFLSVRAKDLWYSALFIRNAYGVGGSAEVAHYWSLAVEEQFYLAWPLAFLFLGRQTRAWVTVASLVFLTAWRVHGGVHFGVTAGGGQALLCGCLLAQLRCGIWHRLDLSSGRWQSPIVAAASVISIVVIVFGVGPGAERHQGFQVVALCAIALVINYLIDGHRDLGSQALSNPLVEWVGRLSYSLYLWQQLFCWSDLASRYAASHWPLLIAASFGGAAFSFYAIERPALSLRDRLAA